MQHNEIGKISKQLIANNKIDEAIKVLMNFGRNNNMNKKVFNSLILISSKYNTIKKKASHSILSNSEHALEISRIAYDLLLLIDDGLKDIPKNKKNIELVGNNNIIFQDVKGGSISIEGDFEIGDSINKDEELITRLLRNKSKIKILFLASNPLDTNPLRLDQEMREIETELIRSKYRDQFEFIKFSAVRIKDLQDGLLNYSPNFVHFSGHGNNDGIALLDNRTDATQLVQSEPLANLFKLFSNDLACVFLNSCFSEEQGKLIKRFIPNVIGMKNAVPDNTAIEFATVFYKGIGAGREIGFSFELAKNSIDLNNISGSDIPIYL